MQSYSCQSFFCCKSLSVFQCMPENLHVCVSTCNSHLYLMCLCLANTHAYLHVCLSTCNSHLYLISLCLANIHICMSAYPHVTLISISCLSVSQTHIHINTHTHTHVHIHMKTNMCTRTHVHQYHMCICGSQVHLIGICLLYFIHLPKGEEHMIVCSDIRSMDDISVCSSYYVYLISSSSYYV